MMRAHLYSALFALAAGCGSSTTPPSNSPDGGTAQNLDFSMVQNADGAHVTPSGANLPLVTPPVKAAAPAGFGGGAGLGGASLDPMDIKSRFFGMGPTYIFRILGDLDGRIMEVNGRGTSPCLNNTPVAYNVTPFGQTVPFYAQCYETGMMGSDPGIFQFGQKDGVAYLYFTGSVSWTAAIVTPLSGQVVTPVDGSMTLSDGGSSTDSDGGSMMMGGSDGGGMMMSGSDGGGMMMGGSDGGTTIPYLVQAWIGIGYNNGQPMGCNPGNGWDNCSYGVIQLSANSQTSAFEMAVAGIGFGYCGAQLKSDGTTVYAKGSGDMGSTCNTPDTLCVAASDVTTPAMCDMSIQTFSLPPLGRAMSTGTGGKTWAASQYPGGSMNAVTLDGTDSDSLRFGPTMPATGATMF